MAALDVLAESRKQESAEGMNEVFKEIEEQRQVKYYNYILKFRIKASLSFCIFLSTLADFSGLFIIHTDQDIFTYK